MPCSKQFSNFNIIEQQSIFCLCFVLILIFFSINCLLSLWIPKTFCVLAFLFWQFWKSCKTKENWFCWPRAKFIWASVQIDFLESNGANLIKLIGTYLWAHNTCTKQLTEFYSVEPCISFKAIRRLFRQLSMSRFLSETHKLTMEKAYKKSYFDFCFIIKNTFKIVLTTHFTLQPFESICSVILGEVIDKVMSNWRTEQLHFSQIVIRETFIILSFQKLCQRKMIFNKKPKVVYLHQVIDAFFTFPTFSIVKKLKRKTSILQDVEKVCPGHLTQMKVY